LETPRIALLGMGKMGREIEALARERGVEVVARLDIADVADRRAAIAALKRAQVAIDFTMPEAAVPNIELCLDAGCPAVVGTTGWYAELDRVRALVEKKDGALLFAPNFSVGVALVRALCQRAGELLQGLDGFDVRMTEVHHAQKKDAPSGTALLLRDALGSVGRDVPIESVRTGEVPGHHEVSIESPFEQITIAHDARNRRVFADGALRAALWLRGRKGVFTMDDVLALGAR
jgi:4-hydroxy-tetrahydrodipicolinate reductase